MSSLICFFIRIRNPPPGELSLDVICSSLNSVSLQSSIERTTFCQCSASCPVTRLKCDSRERRVIKVATDGAEHLRQSVDFNCERLDRYVDVFRFTQEFIDTPRDFAHEDTISTDAVAIEIGSIALDKL
jgi:hypothetical protein